MDCFQVLVIRAKVIVHKSCYVKDQNALGNEDDLGQPVAIGRTFRNEKHLQEKEAGLGFYRGRETRKSPVGLLSVLGKTEGNM